jgi:hypothetical protein
VVMGEVCDIDIGLQIAADAVEPRVPHFLPELGQTNELFSPLTTTTTYSPVFLSLTYDLLSSNPSVDRAQVLSSF